MSILDTCKVVLGVGPEVFQLIDSIWTLELPKVDRFYPSENVLRLKSGIVIPLFQAPQNARAFEYFETAPLESMGFERMRVFDNETIVALRMPRFSSCGIELLTSGRRVISSAVSEYESLLVIEDNVEYVDFASADDVEFFVSVDRFQ